MDEQRPYFESTRQDSSLDNNPQPKKPGGKLHDLLSTLGIIILAPIVALFLTNFVFQSYQVDGPSMEKTLQNGDRLIVSKINKTWARIKNSNYIPERYEIIIFNYGGEAPATGLGSVEEVEQKQLIKRVIGIPGDRVVVKDGVVTIFDREHPNGYLVDQYGPERDVIGNTPACSQGNVIDETIKEGEVYVMGDNRENSLDSRCLGAISADQVVGRLAYRIFPFDKTTSY